MPLTHFDLTDRDLAELANLYHLARTALSHLDHVPTRSERKCWAAEQFAKVNDITVGYAYKGICRAID